MMTAYCGPPPTPLDWLAQWNFDPLVIGGLALLLVGGYRLAAATHRTMVVAAVAVLALLFVSPLCGLTTALFSARALHHLLLVTVAAPLLALAFPHGRRAATGGPFLLATAVFWAWHIPVLYGAALADTGLYWLMQASLLATAVVFWRAVFSPGETAGALIAVIGATAQMGLLGALLAFAPLPLYAPHLASTLPWGLGPLADQQLAGMIMWVPGMLPYGIAAAVLARRGWRLAAT
ncbi:cytochrome c oxidase assembly protein [Polymorphobacter fuscus]|uniref:Cytochrome c oxidase assembly protein n=1 Tax=Sandarakinorhabdus fusca TaxID=1439888 RepID=A0A7C9GXP3_9SPHN|nr:cytochrome c oxidase assembly protein [Polymorphobacter fuscus]KAB7646259.1 cytochrome c oxidase assembly protein [Polymorphobacter fuscus]MQT17474.1 cytochrome c oxidase assembly protein [Polymorphobacter fuscus]NJC09987.1 putative membrane protein [Polymorphobacter fuscus]